MATPGIPSQMKALNARVDAVEKALDEEAAKRAFVAEQVAKLWMDVRWIEKKIKELLGDVTNG